VVGVRNGVRDRLPACRLGTSYRWLKIKSASEPADLSDKFYPTGR
jgi:hypothetical protein